MACECHLHHHPNTFEEGTFWSVTREFHTTPMNSDAIKSLAQERVWLSTQDAQVVQNVRIAHFDFFFASYRNPAAALRKIFEKSPASATWREVVSCAREGRLCREEGPPIRKGDLSSLEGDREVLGDGGRLGQCPVFFQAPWGFRPQLQTIAVAGLRGVPEEISSYHQTGRAGTGDSRISAKQVRHRSGCGSGGTSRGRCIFPRLRFGYFGAAAPRQGGRTC